MVTLFLNLVLLSLMGMAVEDAWGTRQFLTLFALPALYWLTEPFRAAPRPRASDR